MSGIEYPSLFIGEKIDKEIQQFLRFLNVATRKNTIKWTVKSKKHFVVMVDLGVRYYFDVRKFESGSNRLEFVIQMEKSEVSSTMYGLDEPSELRSLYECILNQVADGLVDAMERYVGLVKREEDQNG